MTQTEFVKIGYGYRVMRDGWAVGRLVRAGDGMWSVQGNDHAEVAACSTLASAKRLARDLPSRG